MKFYTLRNYVEKLVIQSAMDHKTAQRLLMILFDHQATAASRYEKNLISHRQQLVQMKAVYMAEDQVLESLKKKVVAKIGEYEGEVQVQ